MKNFLLSKPILIILSLLGIASQANAQCSAGETEVFIDVVTDAFGYEVYWELVPTGQSCGGTTIFTGGNTNVGCSGGGLQLQAAGGYGNSTTTTEGGFCLTIGNSYDIIAVDDWGDGGTCFVSSAQSFNFCQGSTDANNTFTFTVVGDDLGLTDNSEYTMMPFVQANGMNMDVTINNIGTTNVIDAIVQTKVFLLPDVINHIDSITSGTKSVNASSSLTITNGTFAPTVDGDYLIRHIVSSDSLTDDNPSNDTVLININVGLTFARDDGDFSTSLGVGAGAGQNTYLGQSFTLATAAVLDSISFFIYNNGPGDSAMVGLPASVVVFSTSSGTPDTIIASTDTITVTTTGPHWITLGMNGGPLSLGAGEYYFGAVETDTNLTIGTSTDIFTLEKTWITWAGNPFGSGVWSNNEDFGFDVTYMLRAKFAPPCIATDSTISPTMCDSYTSPSGKTFTTSNTYSDTIPNADGCDSIITINLTINNSTTGTEIQTACDSYTWTDGITYTASNSIATDTLVNSAGCDSVITLNLTINNSSTGTDVQTACNSYTWIDGITYTSSNSTATDILTNVAGCDSVITLNLTISNSTTGTDVQTACDSYTWTDGITYTSSNSTATDTLANTAGCDSVITLNLTINNSSTGTDVQTACDSYTWTDGITYTSSNSTATDTLANTAGCDSVITLNLTISNSTTGTDVQTACDSYTWTDGITYTSSNSTATDTLANTAGCDSVITLNLTISNSTSGTDVQAACGSYTWTDGITYTSSNSTATDILTNAAGCDSVITLNLTINNSTTGTDVQSACDSYTWTDGITYTSSNSTATDTLTNSAGCDSVITLNLTIGNNTGTDVQTACDSYTWTDGITYTSSNSTATFNMVNGGANGCDSLVTLDLTINTVDVSVTTTNSTITANATGASYQWLDCSNNNSIIVGETAQVFVASLNGDYSVEVAKNGCTDTSTCITISVISIEKHPLFTDISIYPNPNRGLVNIEFGELKEVSIKVLSSHGTLIYREENINTSNYQFELPAASGIYFIEISSQGKLQRYKVAKE